MWETKKISDSEMEVNLGTRKLLDISDIIVLAVRKILKQHKFHLYNISYSWNYMKMILIGIKSLFRSSVITLLAIILLKIKEKSFPWYGPIQIIRSGKMTCL